ncbi:MAG: hypothetical protein ACREPA_08795 [Candidatus Dormibacteraceae bacterium]
MASHSVGESSIPTRSLTAPMGKTGMSSWAQLPVLVEGRHRSFAG